jgi:adenylate cyclase
VNGARPEGSLVLDGSGRRFPLASGPSWAIGRSDGCAVVLDSRSVSRLHALIQRMETGDFCLIDLGSRNGSFVNGRRVSIPVTLHDQDKILFGDQTLCFQLPAGRAITATPEANLRNAPTTSLLTHTSTTIVVVDIRDFTPLARSVSEELLSQTIGTWFLRVGKIAQELGSWAQKYSGDAVMAVWVHNRPEEMRCDLFRALEAVWRIQAATEELSRELPLPGPLRIGAGVNTGLAIIGGSDFTALGETVNAAFRLEAATKALRTGVALGPRAFEALAIPSDAAGCFERREVKLKGYEEDSTAYAISFVALEAFVREQTAG